MSQTTQRDRDYRDAVNSSLSEWSQGGSRSSTTGAAGGIGFALGPVVIGGGAAHGSASSSSWQTGGRRVAASEQQSLRDAIRQYGDSVRQLESTVVTEVTQEEEVEGVSETVRNINYCHALTVMYHQILRHYRVDTAFAGVRECLFVPFSITPFDVNKALKWRDKLRNGLMARDLRWAIDRLDEVATGWVDSDVPPGRRSSHPVSYLTGSAYIRMSIERPRDREEEEEIQEYRKVWNRIAPLLNVSASAVIARLEKEEAQRDAYFQREVAPGVAARWSNRLRLVVNGETLAADFTLASSYKFGGTVRVDFTVPVDDRFNRQALQDVTFRSDDPLPVGSVANLTRASYRYFTQHFDATTQSVPGTNDLVLSDTGAPDASGAVTRFPLTPWERQNLRRVIEDAVDKLIVHLNANLVYYHKVIWWLMDRDELYMLLDGFTAPYGRRLENGKWVDDTGRSLASVVEREPIAILGNALVFRVAGGVFLGIDGHDSPTALHDYYYDGEYRPQPLRVSLSTDGLYAQAILDPCEACEEHFGSTDWVLSSGEPELEALAGQLGTRRVEPEGTQPSQMPDTLINLQNAPAAPDPTGLAGILRAVTDASAFRDMAGLQGTQANAMGALTSAASLASSFGQMAVDFQKSKQGTADAKQKLSNIRKAKSEGLIDDGEAQRQSSAVLSEQNMAPAPTPLLEESPISDALSKAGASGQPIEVTRQGKEGVETVRVGSFRGDETASLTEPVQQVCGFFGPQGAHVTEDELRDMVRTRAVEERANWWDATGAVLEEDADSQFGHLVAYWLSSNSRIRPTTLERLKVNARAMTAAQFGDLLAQNPTAAQVAAAAVTARGHLLQGAPDVGFPTDLNSQIDQSLLRARLSRTNANGLPWSAVFVSDCIRSAAMQLGLEGLLSGPSAGGLTAAGRHVGRDQILTVSSAHRVYTLAAYRARFGPNPRTGTYHAFETTEIEPKVGDIIIQDRRGNIGIGDVLAFNNIPAELTNDFPLHGDIVVEVVAAQNYVVTIGGNLGDSSRIRHYPLDGSGQLVVAQNQLFVRENDAQVLQALPRPYNGADLNDESTGRIFAVLSPVQACAAIPGQEFGGGMLV